MNYPATEQRGIYKAINIARAYFYMDLAYPGHGINKIRLMNGNVSGAGGLKGFREMRTRL
jgi:hypothetical protein